MSSILDGIDKETGIVEDCKIETYYKPLESIEINEEAGFVRVTMDENGCFLETRIPLGAFAALGFVRN